MTCRSCGRPIRWVRTMKGKHMPLDARPTDDGTIVVEAGVGRVLTPLEALTHEGERWTPHWATCPDADDWRGRGKEGER